jgi:hypothetical protein
MLVDRFQHVRLGPIGRLQAHDVPLPVGPGRKGHLGHLNLGLRRAGRQQKTDQPPHEPHLQGSYTGSGFCEEM